MVHIYSTHLMRLSFPFLLLCILFTAVESSPSCGDLLFGQYSCSIPPIDQTTNELQGCTPNNTVSATCTALPGVQCEGPLQWEIEVPCRYTNGYKYTTAISLSVFLGYFGIDRFYLGYPTIAFLKLITFGGFVVGNLIDIMLIANQVVKPADGSGYIISQFGNHWNPYTENNSSPYTF